MAEEQHALQSASHEHIALGSMTTARQVTQRWQWRMVYLCR
jgi:hypothetical protein